MAFAKALKIEKDRLYKIDNLSIGNILKMDMYEYQRELTERAYTNLKNR